MVSTFDAEEVISEGHDDIPVVELEGTGKGAVVHGVAEELALDVEFKGIEDDRVVDTGALDGKLDERPVCVEFQYVA